MAHVRSEGYGAEWIEVPDELLPFLGVYTAYFGEYIFVVSRSGEDIFCFFILERKVGQYIERIMFLSTSCITKEIPTWVSFSGVPQYLFDNIIAPLLKGQRAFLTGHIIKMEES